MSMSFIAILPSDPFNEDMQSYLQIMQRLRWKQFVVRGEQQVIGEVGQAIDDLRLMPFGFREYGQKGMSEFAKSCREAGLEEMFFMALKKKMTTKTTKSTVKNDAYGKDTKKGKRRKKKSKNH